MPERDSNEPLVAIEIRGLYDGVCVWVFPDGRLVNRFAEWNTPLEQRIDAWIEKNAAGIRRQYGLPEGDPR